MQPTARRDGMIGGVWLADLDGDGAPELVVATSSAGTGTYGSVEVYWRRDAALAGLHVKPLGDDQRSGYMGHDLFSIEGGRLYSAWVSGVGSRSEPGGGAVKPNWRYRDRVAEHERDDECLWGHVF